jgi:hypothetical protein
VATLPGCPRPCWCIWAADARDAARVAKCGELGGVWLSAAVVSSGWGLAWAVKCRVAPIVLLISRHHGDGVCMAGGLLGCVAGGLLGCVACTFTGEV